MSGPFHGEPETVLREAYGFILDHVAEAGVEGHLEFPDKICLIAAAQLISKTEMHKPILLKAAELIVRNQHMSDEVVCQAIADNVGVLYALITITVADNVGVLYALLTLTVAAGFPALKSKDVPGVGKVAQFDMELCFCACVDVTRDYLVKKLTAPKPTSAPSLN